ncbi:MAG: TOTE conflict system archaeo-eukaryotic primase domain-containing protein [Leucobacter sp.]
MSALENKRESDAARARLVSRITELESQLFAARRDLDIFDAQLEPPVSAEEETLSGKIVPAVTASSSSVAKVALFMARFQGRSDVYATRWVSKRTGKPGWSPAVRGGFYSDAAISADYLPIDERVVERHLTGDPGPSSDSAGYEFHVGIYPMLDGDECRFLVCDFDDADWKRDATAYVQACRKAGIDVLAEISRSGEGAHVWMFFEVALPAAIARAAGTVLLKRAMDASPSMSFDSYDRFFPAQDMLPRQSTGRARLGNLIALPLQGDCRRRGTSVFADPETWAPYPDQFAALSVVVPANQEQIYEIAESVQRIRVGPAETLLPRPKRATLRSGAKDRRDEKVELLLDSTVHVPTEQLPGNLITELKHLASVANPEFFRKQAQRFSTYGTPRYVTCFEYDDHELRIPRGLLDEAVQRIEETGFTVKVSKPREEKSQVIALEFTGELRPEQVECVTEVKKHDTGVLVAPPGTGKTVIACALIAEKQVPTAILVNRAELLVQWRERLTQFLSIEEKQIGQLGAGRRKRKGVVDLIMMQTIAHRNGDPTILNEYGQVIIDECHAIAAPAVEAALRQAGTPRWLGMTATPYRSDQMDGLITLQCGPIRHTMAFESNVDRVLRIHATEFTTEEPGTDGPSIQAIYTELAHDASRNALIVDEVTAAVAEKRRCLVLTNRLDHLEALSEGIGQCTMVPVLSLHGRLSPAERKGIRARLAEVMSTGEPFVLVAIDRVAGEGLDLPTLDTLFLAVPISFKGKVVQQLGRITRGSGTDRGAPAIVHDFHDAKVPLLDRMHSRRTRVMRKEGFRIAEA